MRKFTYMLLCLGALIACSKKKQDNDIPLPQKAILISPAANEVCIQGTEVSATQSTVTFKWNAAEATNSYDLYLKNLEDGTITTQNTANTQINITLKRNTPYAWSVGSKSSASNAITISDIWKFYNSGPSITAYTPFPADIIGPGMNQLVSTTNGKVTLKWTGSDVDNDIAGYDIYFGETPSPALLQSNIIASLLEVNVSVGKAYYWKVITKDTQNNKSDSGIYQFTTK